MAVQKRYWLIAATLALFAVCADPASGQNRAPARAARLHAMLIEGAKFSADWSLEQAEKIKEFFFDRFGRALPVSAMGQTPAHERMKYDHSDAMDVAVHPDSREGRVLIGYLRETGIPFIAFRRKVRGSATGPHIHVGNPSPRLEAGMKTVADSSALGE